MWTAFYIRFGERNLNIHSRDHSLSSKGVVGKLYLLKKLLAIRTRVVLLFLKVLCNFDAVKKKRKAESYL